MSSVRACSNSPLWLFDSKKHKTKIWMKSKKKKKKKKKILNPNLAEQQTQPPPNS
jgi:hypothetical protein